jgi:hypothetical protein
MFVRALNRSTSQPRELTLASIKAVEADAAGAAILTQDGAGFYAPHPAEMVRKALTLYTALLGGREEAQVPLPSFSPLSNLPEQTVSARRRSRASFVGAKQKNVTPEMAAAKSCGDAWTWIAIDADSKLICAWLIGKRDPGSATQFVQDLAGPPC